MTQDEIIRMAREAGFGKSFSEVYALRLKFFAEAEGKRLLWACEQARNPDETDEWLRGFDACAAALNAERIET